MISTAEPDAELGEIIDAEFTVDEPSPVARIEYPIALAKVDELKAKYGVLTIAGLNDKAGFAAVDEARKDVKTLKVKVENRRVELKAVALEYGKKVDSAARLIREPLEELERSLATKQKVVTDEVDRLRREAEEKLKAEKAAKLKTRMYDLHAVRAYLSPSEVEALSDDQFTEVLDQKQRAEFERIEAEKALKQQQAEEAERQRAEREQLAAERAELDRQKAEHTAEQRKIEDEKTRLAKIETDRLEEIERQKLEAERVERELIEAQENEKRETAARVRSEQLRPDREKLLAFADQVESLPIPAVAITDNNMSSLISFALVVCAEKIRKIVAENLK